MEQQQVPFILLCLNFFDAFVVVNKSIMMALERLGKKSGTHEPLY